MQAKRRLTLKNGHRRVYKSTNSYRIISQNTQLKKPIIESYEVDMDKLKESLHKIEETYYSSNVKLDRIQKRRTSQILRMKFPTVFKSYKRLFAKY